MRSWIAYLLALAVAVSALTVAGSGGGMASPGCISKVGRQCPCETVAANCTQHCAVSYAQVGILAPAPAIFDTVVACIAVGLAASPALESTIRGVDPPVPRV